MATVERDEQSYSELKDVDLKAVRVGLIKEFMTDGLDSGVKKQIEATVEKLKSQGAIIEEVSIPSVGLALAVYYVLCPAEVSSNLSRYDGQRYGYSSPKATNLNESYSLSRSEGFGDEAKRRIMIGTYVLSSGFYDAYYQKAQLVRTKLINEFNAVFQKYDILIGPTAPVTAFEVGAHTADPLEMYLTDVMTVAANLIGAPSISVPGGKANNMPVGIQLITPQHKDKFLLNFAQKVEAINT